MQELNVLELEGITGGRGKWDWYCGVLAGVTIASFATGNVLAGALVVNKAVAVCGVAVGGYFT